FVIESRDETVKAASISPFVIEKVLQGSVGNVNSCKKMRGGGLLVEVASRAQAESIAKLTRLYLTEVSVSAHRSLNCCRAVVQRWDLAKVTDDEILDGLRSKGVVKAQQILKMKNGSRVGSGTVVLTFGTTQPPAEIKAGYELLKVRPYIPN